MNGNKESLVNEFGTILNGLMSVNVLNVDMVINILSKVVYDNGLEKQIYDNANKSVDKVIKKLFLDFLYNYNYKKRELN